MLEYIHHNGVIVRDITPLNLAMGTGQKSDDLYMFDFGLSRLYVDPETGKHIPYCEGKKNIGSIRFTSYNVNHVHGTHLTSLRVSEADGDSLYRRAKS